METWEDYRYGHPELDPVADNLEMQFGITPVGSTFDFRGYIPGQFAKGLWIAADHYPEFFDYYRERHTWEIHPDLQDFARKHRLYWSWNDPGTIMLYLD